MCPIWNYDMSRTVNDSKDGSKQQGRFEKGIPVLTDVYLCSTWYLHSTAPQLKTKTTTFFLGKILKCPSITREHPLVFQKVSGFEFYCPMVETWFFWNSWAVLCSISVEWIGWYRPTRLVLWDSHYSETPSTTVEAHYDHKNTRWL